MFLDALDESPATVPGILRPIQPFGEGYHSTVFGEVLALTMEASDCIFNDAIEAVRRQEGCIRFCYVPEGSKTPHCFHCQPELEISRQISEAGGQQHLSKVVRDAIREKVLGWLIPSFTSTQYGHHAYGQLSQTCPLAIRIGADDGSEMGVF